MRVCKTALRMLNLVQTVLSLYKTRHILSIESWSADISVSLVSSFNVMLLKQVQYGPHLNEQPQSVQHSSFFISNFA
jgi:hypothetical protein